MRLDSSLIVIFLFLILTGCFFPNIESRATITLEPVNFTASPTISTPISTPKLTDTPVPPSTPSPTETQEPIWTATLTPSPTSILANAQIYRIGWLESGYLLITLLDEDIIEGDYYALVDGIEFNCRVPEGQEKQLICVGTGIMGEKEVIFSLFEAANDSPILQAMINIPPKHTPTSSSKDDGKPTNPPPSPTPTDDSG